MDIADILGSVQPSGSASKGKVKATLAPSVVEFVRFLSGHSMRITYSACTALVRGPGGIPKCMPFSSPSHLPVSLQPFVCRNSGDYHPSAPGKWGEDAPSLESLKAMKIIGGDDILSVYERWVAAKSAE